MAPRVDEPPRRRVDWSEKQTASLCGRWIASAEPLKDLKTYPEGTPFTGRIGRTAATSEAAWPQPPRARAGRAQRARVPARRRRLRAARLLRLGHPHADLRPPRRGRPALPRLPHHRDLLADARVPAHRAQPPLQRRRHHPGDGHRASRATTAWCRARTASCPRCCSRRATRRSASASGTSRSRASTRRARRRRAGRCRAASSASTASSAARPTSGRRRSCTTATTSTRRSRPEEGYHLNADLADQRDRVPHRPAHRRAGQAVLHVLLPRCRPRAASRRARMDRALSRPVRRGLGPLARGSVRAPARRWASCRREPGSRRGRPGSRRGTRCRRTPAASTRGRWRCTPRSSSRPTTTSAASSTSSSAWASSTTRSSCSPRTTARPPKAASTARSTRTSSSTASSRPIEENLKHLDDWGSVRSFPNYSWGWAWAGNTPLRRWKRYLHQGGMSDPLIVHWPKGIAARGEVRGQYVHVVDVAPTILEALGLAAAGRAQRRRAAPARGRELRAHVQRCRGADAQEGAVLRDDRLARAVGRRLEGGRRAAAGRPADRRDARARRSGSSITSRATSPSATTSRSGIRRSSPSWSSSGGSRRASTTCCRSTRACSCAWASASRARCPTGNRYVYYPGGAPQFEYTAVNVKNRSHTITADVEIPAGGAEGVLLAHGSWFAGYSLYVKDGAARLRAQPHGARRVPHRVDRGAAAGQSRARVPLHAHRRASRARRALRRRATDRRRRDPAHGPARDRDLRRRACAAATTAGCRSRPTTAAPFRFTGRIEQVVVELDGAAARATPRRSCAPC